MGIEFTELQCISNFSFLQGASHPEEFVSYASNLGYNGISITDENSFAGTVRAYFHAKKLNLKYTTGCRLIAKDQCLHNPFEVLAYPKSRDAYARICKLLSEGNLKAEKGDCLISLDNILAMQKDQIFISIPPRTLRCENSDYSLRKSEYIEQVNYFYKNLDNRRDFYLALSYSYSNIEKEREKFIFELSRRLNCEIVASNDALYHSPERKALHDVLTCIKHQTTIDNAGFILKHNNERYLKNLSEIERQFRKLPQAIKNTVKIADCCSFNLNQLTYEYPKEVRSSEMPSIDYLRKLSFEGARRRYSENIPQNVVDLLEKELALIKQLKYEDYFLTCYDIVKEARRLGILCQGRGAAANSAVCYCLEITSVDPARIDLLFERFVSQARNEPPDIDIDFEHERREEIILYIYNKYGRERAGLVSNVITYRQRGAVRDVGKALGYSLTTVNSLTSLIHQWNKCRVEQQDIIKLGINPEEQRFKCLLKLSEEIIGFPRHLSQHCGGFVICERNLCETVPILKSAMPSRTIIEWNKDDIELLGMLKVDILALGMLTCIRKALSYINTKLAPHSKKIELHTIPPEEPAVYDMLCKADTLGVFQVESRAQMSMLPRLKPRSFYDLVIEVAIVRPGPIHGQMVHPYLRRRMGLEKVSYPTEKIKRILQKTLGVPLFQEQAMRLVMEAADFTPDQAEQLRRSIAAWKRNKESLNYLYAEIRKGMQRNGYSESFTESCLSQMKGFSEYGFPESHAASFALLVYASAWVKAFHPAEFAAALINSQPMGFYAPSQIIRDAIQHGVNVLPVDIKTSQWDCTVNTKNEMRLGFRLVKGLHENQIERLVYLRSLLPEIKSIEELYCSSGMLGFQLRKDTLSLIAKADGFKSLNLSLREALWIIKGLPERSAAFDKHFTQSLPQLPLITLEESMYADYRATGLSLKAHPIGLLRQKLRISMVSTSSDLKSAPAKSIQKVAGLVICRQRPQTSKGTVFLTLEDEEGIVNLIIWPKIYEANHRVITSSVSVIAQGSIERSGEVMHMIVRSIASLDDISAGLTTSGIEGNTHSY